MRILLVHNKYQQAGGEDAVVQAEYDLLATEHEVQFLIFDNEAANGLSGKWAMATGLFDNPTVAAQINQILDTFKPDVVHVHNVWYAAGPSILKVIKVRGIPLIQTLHNYRQVCLNGLLSRDGQNCTLCLTKTFAWPGIVYRCNKGSAMTSTIVAAALAWHRSKGTFLLADKVICLTTFQQQQLQDSDLGFRPSQLVIKPNFCQDPTNRDETSPEREDFLLFAGRLITEKGAHLLPMIADAGYKVMVAGTGDLLPDLQKAAAQNPNLILLGWQTEVQVTKLMLQAKALILLSTCHEGLPVVLVKAFAASLPVLAALNPNLSALVTDGYNGFCPDVNSQQDILTNLSALLNSANWDKLSKGARQTYIDHYTPAANLQLLQNIYQQAISEVKMP